jgi:hypothetical protein
MPNIFRSQKQRLSFVFLFLSFKIKYWAFSLSKQRLFNAFFLLFWRRHFEFKDQKV